MVVLHRMRTGLMTSARCCLLQVQAGPGKLPQTTSALSPNNRFSQFLQLSFNAMLPPRELVPVRKVAHDRATIAHSRSPLCTCEQVLRSARTSLSRCFPPAHQVSTHGSFLCIDLCTGAPITHHKHHNPHSRETQP